MGIRHIWTDFHLLLSLLLFVVVATWMNACGELLLLGKLKFVPDKWQHIPCFGSVICVPSFFIQWISTTDTEHFHSISLLFGAVYMPAVSVRWSKNISTRLVCNLFWLYFGAGSQHRFSSIEVECSAYLYSTLISTRFRFYKANGLMNEQNTKYKRISAPIGCASRQYCNCVNDNRENAIFVQKQRLYFATLDASARAQEHSIHCFALFIHLFHPVSTRKNECTLACWDWQS